MKIGTFRELNKTKILELVFMPAAMILFGMTLNLIVIHANDGMPVPGIESQSRWVALTCNTRFVLLGDIFPGYLSIGDLLTFSGLMLYLILLFCSAWQSRREHNEKIN